MSKIPLHENNGKPQPEDKSDAVTLWLLVALFCLGVLCIGSSVLLEVLGLPVPRGLLELGSAIVGSLVATWRFRTSIQERAIKDCADRNSECPLRKKN